MCHWHARLALWRSGWAAVQAEIQANNEALAGGLRLGSCQGLDACADLCLWRFLPHRVASANVLVDSGCRKSGQAIIKLASAVQWTRFTAWTLRPYPATGLETGQQS